MYDLGKVLWVGWTLFVLPFRHAHAHLLVQFVDRWPVSFTGRVKEHIGRVPGFSDDERATGFECDLWPLFLAIPGTIVFIRMGGPREAKKQGKENQEAVGAERHHRALIMRA